MVIPVSLKQKTEFQKYDIFRNRFGGDFDFV
jgi:hypothetical protein